MVMKMKYDLEMFSKVLETQGFLYQGHSKWTVCCLFSQNVQKMFQLFHPHNGSPIPYYPRERKSEYEKRELTKNG